MVHVSTFYTSAFFIYLVGLETGPGIYSSYDYRWIRNWQTTKRNQGEINIARSPKFGHVGAPRKL